MKKSIPVLFSLMLLIIMGFDTGPTYYGPYQPVFMMRPDMEQNVKLSGPEPVMEPGKIYIKDHLIFINEKYHGIHIIDNSNPENPLNIGFIRVDGCIDMAVKNDVLYADNAVDLIAIRISENLTGIEVTKRIKNVFPQLPAPDGRSLYWEERQAMPENAILVRWDKN